MEPHSTRGRMRPKASIISVVVLADVPQQHISCGGEEMEGAALGQLPLGIATAPRSTPRALLDPQPRLLAERSGDLGVDPDVGHIPLG